MTNYVVRFTRTSLISNVGGFSNCFWPSSCSFSSFAFKSRNDTSQHYLHKHLGVRNSVHHNFLLSQSRLFSNSTVLNGQDPENKPKEGIVKRFKVMAKDYWYVLIPVHVATSIVWFGGFYLLAKSGVDIIALLEAIHIPRSYLDKLEGSSVGYYAIAYACYKVATPARYTVTVGGTTYAIVKLKEKGFIKTASQMSDSLKDKRDEYKDKYDDIKDKAQEKYQEKIDKYQEKKDRYQEKYDEAWEKFSKTKRK